MIVFDNIDEVNIKNPVITLGFFDGVHIGHSKIINTVTQIGKNHNNESLLITFWPHPRIVLNNDFESLKLVTTLEEKKNLIFAKGINAILVMNFTLSLASTNAFDFIKDYLVGKLKASAIVLGYNHAFGHKGQGNFNLLKQHENSFGYHALQVEPVSFNGTNVSSTKIREAIETGNLEVANAMLDRPYSLSGTIEGGRQIGRVIGYPTANIKPADQQKQIPGNGVYAIWVDYDGQSYPAMLNIGIKPTIGSGLEKTIEAHIIGFNKNIYNETINLRFIKKIREEQRFLSLDELKIQLSKDKQTVTSILPPH